MPKQERQKLGVLGREHVQKNYNFEKFNKSWIELMDKIIEEKGSWDSRVGYKPWHMKEIA